MQLNNVSAIFSELTDASKMTLEHQGGRMSREEASVFENNPDMEKILRMRVWDELAKDPDAEMPPLEKYETMFREYISKVL